MSIRSYRIGGFPALAAACFLILSACAEKSALPAQTLSTSCESGYLCNAIAHDNSCNQRTLPCLPGYALTCDGGGCGDISCSGQCCTCVPQASSQSSSSSSAIPVVNGAHDLTAGVYPERNDVRSGERVNILYIFRNKGPLGASQAKVYITGDSRTSFAATSDSRCAPSTLGNPLIKMECTLDIAPNEEVRITMTVDISGTPITCAAQPVTVIPLSAEINASPPDPLESNRIDNKFNSGLGLQCGTPRTASAGMSSSAPSSLAASSPQSAGISSSGVSSSVAFVPTSSAISSVTSQATVPGQADIELVHSGPENASPGQLATYGVTVKNLGPATATDVQTVIVVPFTSYSDGTVFMGALQPLADSRCTISKRGVIDVITCAIGTLAVGQSTQINYAVRVPATIPCGVHMYRNTSFTLDQTDANAQNSDINSRRTFITNCRFGTSYTFSQSAMQAAPGEYVTFTMQFSQITPDSKDTAAVDFSFPTSLQYSEETMNVSPPNPIPARNECIRNGPQSTGHRHCFYHPLRQGDLATYSITFRVLPTAVCGEDIVLDVTPFWASPADLQKPEGIFTATVRVACDTGCTEDAECGAPAVCGGCEGAGGVCQRICLQPRCIEGACTEQYEWNTCPASSCQ